MTKIFAFDPGETTGYCCIEVPANNTDRFDVLKCLEVEWSDRLHDIYALMSEVTPLDYVVIESFRLFPHRAMAQVGSQMPSSRVTGVIETCHYVLGMARPIAFQEPGDIARVSVEDEHIQWVAGSPHKIDAYRHARLFWVKHIHLDPFNRKAA